MMDYDVLILGGGINGCAIGYELSKFSLNIALIEKEYEVANDVFPIFYNKSYDKNSISSKTIEKFNIRNKVCKYTEIDGKSYTNTKSLSSVQIISAYDLAIGYGEVAFDNGVNFRLHEKVLTIEKISNGYRIVTNKNKFTCKIVIDTLQQEDTEGDNFSIKCFTIDKEYKFKDNQIMDIKVDTEKKMIIAPNLDGDLYAYLYSNEKMCSVKALDILKSLLTDLEDEYIKDNFDISYKNQEIKIENSKIGEGYFKVVGKNLNVVNMIPDISKNICKEVINILQCKMKKDFHDKVREFYRFNYMAKGDINNLIKNNSEYGNIICTCCNISEGEIIECIRRPLGARTIDGIVKRTGAMIGRCGGSYCINKITRILARETNKNLIDVVKNSTDSNVLAARIKEFNGV